MIKIEMSFETMVEAMQMMQRITGMGEVTGGTPLKITTIDATKLSSKNEPAPGVYGVNQLIHTGVYNEEQLQPKAEAPKEEPSLPKPDESAAPGVTYEQLTAAIMKLVAKSPAEMKKVCEAFGLKTFKGTTDPELWAKAKAMIDAKVAV